MYGRYSGGRWIAETEREKLFRLQREAGASLLAARTAVDNCEFRFNAAKEAFEKYDQNPTDKCQCCPTCGKEKA